MKSLFITALTYIRLPGALGRGIRLPSDLILTNDRALIGELLSPRFELIVGHLEASALRNAHAVVYSIKEYPDKELQDPQNARLLLINSMRSVQTFLQSLWLIKDNSVNFELGFQEFPFKKGYTSSVNSNFLAFFVSKADGSRDFTEFDSSEARAARDIATKLFSPSPREAEDQGYIVPEDFNRLSRVLHFLQVARASSDLGLKVAHYVTCFEALFSTDSTELAHKLAERMALFLGKNVGERTKIFKQVKAAYNIRSKVVHGDKITKKIAEQIHELLRSCDELLRGSLMKILTTPNLPGVFLRSPNDLEDYFIGMVLDNGLVSEQ